MSLTDKKVDYNFEELLKGIVIQIEKALIDDRLRVLKLS